MILSINEAAAAILFEMVRGYIERYSVDLYSFPDFDRFFFRLREQFPALAADFDSKSA